jgi:hypothetical protein
MTEKEEKAWQHFEELKGTLQELSPCWWKKHFKHHVDKFIGECLDEAITIFPLLGEEGEDAEKEDRICLHGLRRLVTGAVQEWELVQQPKHVATFAKLDGALVWQGRGYVSPILHAICSLQPSFQSKFTKVWQTLWLVMLNSSYFSRYCLRLA